MQYSVGKTGRVVVAKLQTGEPIYASVENLARKEGIRHAVLWIIGCIEHGGVVVGPRRRGRMPLKVFVEHFDDRRELLATGTLFPDKHGAPKLHLHAAIGKNRKILVGCPRDGADCWLVNEVIIVELANVRASRLKDAATGLTLLTIGRDRSSGGRGSPPAPVPGRAGTRAASRGRGGTRPSNTTGSHGGRGDSRT